MGLEVHRYVLGAKAVNAHPKQSLGLKEKLLLLSLGGLGPLCWVFPWVPSCSMLPGWEPSWCMVLVEQ